MFKIYCLSAMIIMAPVVMMLLVITPATPIATLFHTAPMAMVWMTWVCPVALVAGIADHNLVVYSAVAHVVITILVMV